MMLDCKEVIEAVLENKIIAIVRGVEGDDCLKLAKALYEGGIRLMELTFDAGKGNAKATADSIAAIIDAFGGKMLVGAGTVTSTALVDFAHESGARFMVAPNTNPKVIRHAAELGLMTIPGAMTPTEILTARDAGADFVKLFPASELGLAYFKAVRAPISDVGLIPFSGINDRNARAFLDAGAVAIGVGSMLADRSIVAAGRFDLLTEAAVRLRNAIE